MAIKYCLFGPAHAGKSTIAGYMLWKANAERAEQEIARARASLGTNFRPTDALAYLVDKSTDERLRRGGGSTSKRMHVVNTHVYANMSAIEYDIIDTPGGWSTTRNDRMRGMFYADAGVFVIEARTLVSDRDLTAEAFPEVFGALFAWVALKPKATLIVAISKMDVEEFDQKLFEEAKDRIKRLLGPVERLKFVPIAVDVPARSGTSVHDDDSRPHWYDGRSVASYLEDALPQSGDSRDEPSVMVITRSTLRPGLGHAYLGKVLKGSFSKDDRVRLLPVSLTKGEHGELSAKVRGTTRTGKNDVSDTLSRDELGGLLLGRESGHGWECTSTTIAVKEGTEVTRGRYILFDVPLDKADAEWLRWPAQVEFIWLGRVYAAKIYEIKRTSQTVTVGAVFLQATDLVCPLDSAGAPVFAEALVGPPNDVSKLMTVRLVSIGSVRGVRINLPQLISRIQATPSSTAFFDGVTDVVPADEVTLESLAGLIHGHLYPTERDAVRRGDSAAFSVIGDWEQQ